MWIDPFFGGVATTLLAEFGLLALAVIWRLWKNGRR